MKAEKAGIASNPSCKHISVMSVLTAHRFTVDEFYRMVEIGVIPPQTRVELIEGQIIDMLPIGPFHSGILNELAEIFTLAADAKWIVTVQSPLRLDEQTAPQPDLMLLRPPHSQYRHAHPTPEDVLLLIEVADSSLTYDRATKLPQYARANVAEVWIVNLPERKVEIHREPDFGAYQSTESRQPGEQITPAACPKAVISIGDLLGK